MCSETFEHDFARITVIIITIVVGISSGILRPQSPCRPQGGLQDERKSKGKREVKENVK